MTEPAIERRIHGGRGVVSHDDASDRVAGWPEVAYESIRALNHLTGGGEPTPAPTLYQVLGELKMIGHGLPQALEQMADGLQRSLGAFAVYDDARDPAASVAQATNLLKAAAQAANRMGEVLEQAQSVIARQGYRSSPAPPETIQAPDRRTSSPSANWTTATRPPARSV